MSIQRAEELKRDWTDRFVKVQSGVPELRRFEGLVGTVKTVNMNCRLLIEFDTPADISWYDIDPQFVHSLTAEEAKQISEASKTTESSADKTSAKPTAAAKTSSAAKPVAGGSPLDAIRAGGAAAAKGTATGTPAAKPSVGSSPLDAIRASGAAVAKGSESETQAAKPVAGGSPLDQIRAAGAAAAKGTASEKSATKPAAGGSPLDAIRASGAAAAKSETPPAAKPVVGGSPLDQIRAQSGAGSTAGAATSTNAAANTATASDASAAGAAGQTVAMSAGTTATGEAAAAVVGTVSAKLVTEAGDNKSSSDETGNADAAESVASLPNALMGSSTPSGVATPDSNSAQLSSLDQVRAQASADSSSESGIGGVQQTLFDQVKQQAASDDADSAEKTSATSEPSLAGVEDRVKQTFKGKKLPKQDDLKIVEGIGPKIEELFRADGIETWKQLSQADPSRLQKILEDAGPRFRMHNPATWPQQAALADDGKWQELEQLQDDLDGGRPA